MPAVTHWSTCWRDRTHPECARAYAAALEQAILAYRGVSGRSDYTKWREAQRKMFSALRIEVRTPLQQAGDA